MKDLIEQLINGGYAVETTKGGGQIKVSDGGGRVVTQFRVSDGEGAIRERLAGKGIAL